VRIARNVSAGTPADEPAGNCLTLPSDAVGFTDVWGSALMVTSRTERERSLTTALWVLVALSLGVCIGYILCSVMTVASEEQQRAEHRGMHGVPPLEPESRL
jgi:hypothetical protein